MSYSQNEKAIIWLDIFDFLTYKKQEAILGFFNEPKQIFTQFSQNYDKLSKVVSKEEFDKMCYALNYDFLEQYIIELDRQGVVVLT